MTTPRLRVRTALSFPVVPGAPVDPYLNVEVANAGAVAVRLTSVVIQIRGRSESLAIAQWRWQSPDSLPCELEPGSGH